MKQFALLFLCALVAANPIAREEHTHGYHDKSNAFFAHHQRPLSQLLLAKTFENANFSLPLIDESEESQETFSESLIHASVSNEDAHLYCQIINQYIEKAKKVVQGENEQELLCAYFRKMIKEYYMLEHGKTVDVNDLPKHDPAAAASVDVPRLMPRLHRVSSASDMLRDAFGMAPKMHREDRDFMQQLQSGNLFEQWHSQMGEYVQEELETEEDRKKNHRLQLEKEFKQKYESQEGKKLLDNLILGKICLLMLVAKIRGHKTIDFAHFLKKPDVDVKLSENGRLCDSCVCEMKKIHHSAKIAQNDEKMKQITNEAKKFKIKEVRNCCMLKELRSIKPIPPLQLPEESLQFPPVLEGEALGKKALAKKKHVHFGPSNIVYFDLEQPVGVWEEGVLPKDEFEKLSSLFRAYAKNDELWLDV